MGARLLISDSSYRLLRQGDGPAAETPLLAGGAVALLPKGRPLSEASLEAAIERAEDWLMPHAASLRGEALEVIGETGRLRSGLAEVLGVVDREWDVREFEILFLRLVDMATGRPSSPLLDGRQLFVADVLLLRELAHHGSLSLIRVC